MKKNYLSVSVTLVLAAVLVFGSGCIGIEKKDITMQKNVQSGPGYFSDHSSYTDHSKRFSILGFLGGGDTVVVSPAYGYAEAGYVGNPSYYIPPEGGYAHGGGYNYGPPGGYNRGGGGYRH